jgi:hypothetical protein
VNGRQALRRGMRGFAFIVAIACVASGCAEHISKKAAEGAIGGLKQQAPPGEKPAHVIAENAVLGVVDTLDEPAQRERIDRIVAQAVSTAATAAVENATRQLVADLGPDGRGPLAVSIARTGENVSAATLARLGNELAALAPECAGPDPLGCIEKRLQQISRSTAASFSQGVRETIGWQLLLVAFGVGVGGGVLGTWLWSLLHERQERRRALRTAEAQ